jgi:nucleoside-diphosphate-sugar epimerase
MRIFMTGASGWIGSAVIPELLDAGHTVLGLARSDGAADKVAGLGADVLRGELDDLAALRTGAEAADGVVHLGYVHDFSRMDDAARTDLAAIETFGAALAGTGGPLVIASGTLGLRPGEVGTEDDHPAPGLHPRTGNSRVALDLAGQGVRSMTVRFAPTVHGAGGDHGFIATLVGVARERGVSAYVDDGTNRWPAVHRLDAAHLVRLGVDQTPAGTVLHAVAEEGITSRAIAEAIGAGLGLPVQSIPANQAADHFGWIGMFFGADAPASNAKTRALLGWTPTHPTLVEDLAAGAYF